MTAVLSPPRVAGTGLFASALLVNPDKDEDGVVPDPAGVASPKRPARPKATGRPPPDTGGHAGAALVHPTVGVSLRQQWLEAVVQTRFLQTGDGKLVPAISGRAIVTAGKLRVGFEG